MRKPLAKLQKHSPWPCLREIRRWWASEGRSCAASARTAIVSTMWYSRCSRKCNVLHDSGVNRLIEIHFYDIYGYFLPERCSGGPLDPVWAGKNSWPPAIGAQHHRSSFAYIVGHLIQSMPPTQFHPGRSRVRRERAAIHLRLSGLHR